MSVKKIISLVIILISIGMIIFVYNDYFLYKTPILKITKLETIESESDESITQNITGVIMNGKYKGKEYSYINQATFSEVHDDKLNSHSELMVDISEDGETIAGVDGIKRDKYLVLMFMIFIDFTLIIGGGKGVKSLITLLINVVLSVSAVYLYIYNVIKIDILPLFIFISLIFVVLSLAICNGYNRKTLAAIVSAIVSMLVSFGLAFLVLYLYNDQISFWNIDCIDVIQDYKGVFYLSILLSGLGAIMDISITMASSLNELIEKDGNISDAALRKSGQEISKDILGTMTNVMLFTCYISAIPMIILTVKNGLSFIEAIVEYGQIEMIRVLTSCISIVLAIPISLNSSLIILRGRRTLKSEAYEVEEGVKK